MRAATIGLLLLLCCGAVPALGAPSAPSFDCARATAAVNKLVCASPELSALDRKLAGDFNSTKYQGGIDAKAFQHEEESWLHDVRNACADTACLKRAYEARDAAILDESAHAASPASFDETRPFAADGALLAAVRSLIGKPCGGPGEDLPQGAGYAQKAEYQPVIGDDTVVVPRARNGQWFAFLLATGGGRCRVADVVALPGPKQANAFLSCMVEADDGSAMPQSIGFGMRKAGQKVPVGYWEVDAKNAKMIRQPLGVLGWEHKILCNYPETGE